MAILAGLSGLMIGFGLGLVAFPYLVSDHRGRDARGRRRWTGDRGAP